MPIYIFPQIFSGSSDVFKFGEIFSRTGERSGAVKALRYKQAGRGFDFRWCHWNFSVT